MTEQPTEGLAHQKETTVDLSHLLWVDVLEAQPSPMFTEDQTATVRFLLYNRKVACAECGKKRKNHWTCLYEFEVKPMGPFTLTGSGKIHPPLTAVCTDHLLMPAKMCQEKRTYERAR